MLDISKNPEFVRHVRADLRPVRALTAGVVVVIVCFLMGVGMSNAAANRTEFLKTYYYTLLWIQFLLLGLWGLTSCSQSISRERELKTHDFLRTTRLTAAELVAGKLLGVPVLAYFVVGCSLPISVVSGLLGGMDPLILIKTYALLLAFTLFLGLLGLWLSMQSERANVGVVAILLLLPLGMIGVAAESPFPGFAALSPYPALVTWYDTNSHLPPPTVFGVKVSYGWLSLMLWTTLGAWMMLMMVRNFKRDLPDIRLLSRPQVLGLIAYLNLLCYAFVKQDLVSLKGGTRLTPAEFSTGVVTFNGLILFLLGAIMLTSHEDLKVWWRHRAAGIESYWSERGLVWPWLVLAAAIAWTALAVQASSWQGIPVSSWPLRAAAFQMTIFLIFVTRDILFIQSCYLTGLRRPLAGGLLYLILYYFAVGILSTVVDSVAPSRVGYIYALQPFYAVTKDPGVDIVAGAALQIPVIALLLWVITRRLSAAARIAPAPR